MTPARPRIAALPALAGLALCALAGCSDFPKLDSAITAEGRASAYPRISPNDDLLAGVPEGEITDETTAALTARAAALRARASAIRRTIVVDAEEQRRLDEALAKREG